jgi:hypothetical protein
MLGNKSLIIFGLATISLIRLIKVALEGEKTDNQ